MFAVSSHTPVIYPFLVDLVCFNATMASCAQQDEAIDACMDATDAFLEQHRNMCERLKDVNAPPSPNFTLSNSSASIASQAIFLMTRCRRDLNLSAVPIEMMIPQNLQPLLSVRFDRIWRLRIAFFAREVLMNCQNRVFG